MSEDDKPKYVCGHCGGSDFVSQDEVMSHQEYCSKVPKTEAREEESRKRSIDFRPRICIADRIENSKDFYFQEYSHLLRFIQAEEPQVLERYLLSCTRDFLDLET